MAEASTVHVSISRFQFFSLDRQQRDKLNFLIPLHVCVRGVKRSASTLTKADALGTSAYMPMPAHSTAVEVPTQPPIAHSTIPPLEKHSKHPAAYATAHTMSHITLTTHSPHNTAPTHPTRSIIQTHLQHLPPLASHPTPSTPIISHLQVHKPWHHSFPTTLTGTIYITLHMASTLGSPLATQAHTPLEIPLTSSPHWLIPTSSTTT